MARKKKELENLVKQIETDEKTDRVERRIDLSSLKNELTDYINKEIKRNFVDEIDKSNRRLVKEKNKKVIFRDIIIMLLLATIALLLFLMYKDHYFDKYFQNKEEITEKTDDVKKEENNGSKEEKKEDKKEEVKKPSLEEMIDKYGNLLNYYVLNEKSSYKNDFYNANLTSDLKKYLALSTINFNSIKMEDDYRIIEDITLKKVYETLFDDYYSANTFDYDGNKISYMSSLGVYMIPISLMKNDSKIVREIVNIKEENGSIFIETVEGLLDNEKLFNVITLEEIEAFANNSIINYQDKLNKIIYVFKDGKLVNLSK